MTSSFTPLFFSGHNGPLYGVHHAPDAGADRQHGVLFLPPLGQDYKRCHKTLQRLASDLARAGFHVLRFDYAGSGDSAQLKDFSLDSWRQDARDAMHQLQRLSGAASLSAFGVRLGAGVATHLDMPLSSLVLWDPIGDGPAYLAELEQLNNELLHTFRHSFRRGRKVSIPRDQLVGHVFPDAMRAALGHFKLKTPDTGKASRGLWVDAEATPATAVYADHAGRFALEERHCEVTAGCHWRSLFEVGNVIMGQPVARQVLSHFKDETGGHGNSA